MIAAVETKRTIPSLDGLRAVSIGLVIFSHFAHILPLHSRNLLIFQILGQHSVDIFFVISGFLITHLLLKEARISGKISLKRFYVRRFFRIFPAFYFFLLIVGLLSLVGALHVTRHDYVCAATYTFNYCRNVSSLPLMHCWSLSLEEQFYLLWPPCLVLLGREKCAKLTLAIVVLSPLARGISYYIAPSFRGQEGTMLHTRLDTIMFGCLIALLYENPVLKQLCVRYIRHYVVALSLLVFFVSPFLEARFHAKYLWTVGYSLQGVSISALLLFAINRPTTALGCFLNSRPLRHIGLISYSLYLWQQLFALSGYFGLTLSVLFVLALGEASFCWIERPALRLRDRIESRMHARVVEA